MDEIESLTWRIMQASSCISRYSPPMKPFIRFARFKEGKGKQKIFPSLQFWDFDDHLQRIMVGLIRELASPEMIVRLSSVQWANNLQDLYQQHKWILEHTKQTEIPDQDHRRISSITSHMQPGSRILYIGCGTGRECFLLATKGFDVVGIDLNPLLLTVAKEWGRKLISPVVLPVEFICMDINTPGFKPGSFDGFILEFYGSLPASHQILALQRELAVLLALEGTGFVVAQRKKYASYWYRGNAPYPDSMEKWLIPQAALDCIDGEMDDNEERLYNGLYHRTHTLRSLTDELNLNFDVISCEYEKDPRYILALVSRKKVRGTVELLLDRKEYEKRTVSLNRIEEITTFLEKMDILCDFLQQHERNVIQWFENPENCSKENIIEGFYDSAEFHRFIHLLNDVSKGGGENTPDENLPASTI